MDKKSRKELEKNLEKAEYRNTLFTSIILVGISSLLPESELFHLLSYKISENAPKPIKVVYFEKNDVENNGIALVYYQSFN